MRQQRWFVPLVLWCIVALSVHLALAQEATDEPPPPDAVTTAAPTEAPSPEPTAVPTDPPPATPEAPSPEPLPATPEAATVELTLPPTATDEPTAEVTAEPVSDTTDEPTEEATDAPPAEATDVPTAEPTEAPFSDAPELALLLSDRFADVGAQWALGAGWLAVDGVLRAEYTSEQAELLAGVWFDAAAEIDLTGRGSLSVRVSSAGRYTATYDGAGTVSLYRGPTLIGAVAVEPLPDTPRRLHLSTLDDVLRVRLDGVELLAQRDDAPLPPGGIALGGDVDGLATFDDFALFVPVDDLPPTEAAAPRALRNNVPCAPDADLIRVSTAYGGGAPNPAGTEVPGSLSADGRWVAFPSSASNLLPPGEDTNGYPDIFLYDRETCETTRLNVSNDGQQANSYSYDPQIAADGSIVVYQSFASNLPGPDIDDDGLFDVFLFDRNTGQTEMAVAGGSITDIDSFSSDGNLILFSSFADDLVSGDDNSTADVFIYNRQTAAVVLVSAAPDGTVGNAYSRGASLSSNGRYAAFTSEASDLVANDNNGVEDVFVHDMQTGNIERVSVGQDGVEGNNSSAAETLSDDGRYVLFSSWATNLVTTPISGTQFHLFRRDRQTGQTEIVSVLPNSSTTFSMRMAGMSGSGRFIVFTSYDNGIVPEDNDNLYDAFAKDMQTGQIIALDLENLVDVVGINISNDGRYVVFTRRIDMSGTSYDEHWLARIEFPQPPVPDAPALQTPTDGAITADTTPDFAWNVAANAVDYTIEVATSPAFDTIAFTQTLSELTAVPATALADGSYFWRVRGNNAAGAGSWSAVWQFTIETQPPVPVFGPVELRAPQNLAVLSDSTPSLSWGSLRGFRSYRVQLDDSASFDSPLLDETVRSTRFTVGTVLPQGIYFWHVATVDDSGVSGDFSHSAQFAVNIQREPHDGSDSYSDRPRFSWATVRGQTYRLLVADWDDTDFAAPLINETTTGSAYQPPAGLLPNGNYRWRVDVDGLPSPFAWHLRITPRPPSAPRLLEPLNRQHTNADSLLLGWSVPIGSEGQPLTYLIQVDDDRRFRSPAWSHMTGVGELSHLLDLTQLAEVRYYWRTAAVNYLGAVGRWSSPREFTYDTTPPAAPTLRSPTVGAPTRDTTPRLSWNPVRDAVAYEVEISASAAFDTLIFSMGETNRTSFGVPLNLTLESAYFWRVRAVDAAGNVSADSQSGRFIVTADTATPRAPSLTSPATRTQSSAALIALMWTPPDGGPFTYELELDDDRRFGSPELAESTGTNAFYNLDTSALPDGRYYWRTRALDARGVVGAWSLSFELILDR
jgi:Tol biopolymer transport system component